MSSNTNKTATRLQILKSGFKAFVTGNKIPILADAKWTLEIVCLNEQPQILPDLDKTDYTRQAKFYLLNHLWDFQTNITKNKQNWLAMMKNS